MRVALALTLAALGWSCAIVPRDTNGALDRVRGGVLRAGVIEHPPWVVVDRGRVSGIEPRLLAEWAAELGARVEWRPDDIESLADALHRREIDVLAGGLQADTPYAHRLALTQPYGDAVDSEGETRHMVLAVTPGESALLLALDRFLATRRDSLPR